jgi:hypothetical protein
MRVGELLSPIVAARGRENFWRVTISKRMKRRSAYRCTMAEERTAKLTSGNTVAPTGWSYSISGLGVKGKDANDSLEI